VLLCERDVHSLTRYTTDTLQVSEISPFGVLEAPLPCKSPGVKFPLGWRRFFVIGLVRTNRLSLLDRAVSVHFSAKF
jgi:hypothetical protein